MNRLRLPSRLFAGETFSLPLKSSSPKQTALTLQFPIDFLNDPGLQRFVFTEFHDDGFEIRERQFLSRLIGSDALFVDVGAHFGLYSLVLSDAIPGLQCLAVEPEPGNFSILKTNIATNGLISSIFPVRSALGSRNGVGTLRLNSSMGHHLSGRNDSGESEAISVQVLSLGELLLKHSEREWDDRPVWLKIDTEGRELDVFLGASDLFASSRIQGVLWEFRVGHLENPDKTRIVEFLKDFNFFSVPVSNSNMISGYGSEFRKRLVECDLNLSL